MRKILTLALLLGLTLTSCTPKQEKSEPAQEQKQLNSVVQAAIDKENQTFPKEDGAFTYEKASYTEKGVTYLVHVTDDYAQALATDKYIHPMLLSGIGSKYDKDMIAALIDEQQSLTFEFVNEKGDQTVRTITLTPSQMKQRFDGIYGTEENKAQ